MKLLRFLTIIVLFTTLAPLENMISAQNLSKINTYLLLEAAREEVDSKNPTSFFPRAIIGALLSTMRESRPVIDALFHNDSSFVITDGLPNTSFQRVPYFCDKQFIYEDIYSACDSIWSDCGLAFLNNYRNSVSFEKFKEEISKRQRYLLYCPYVMLRGQYLDISVSVHLVGLTPEAQHSRPLSTEWNAQSTGAKFTYVLRDCEWHLESEVYQWNLKCSPKVMAEIDRLKRNGIEFF